MGINKEELNKQIEKLREDFNKIIIVKEMDPTIVSMIENFIKQKILLNSMRVSVEEFNKYMQNYFGTDKNTELMPKTFNEYIGGYLPILEENKIHSKYRDAVGDYAIWVAEFKRFCISDLAKLTDKSLIGDLLEKVEECLLGYGEIVADMEALLVGTLIGKGYIDSVEQRLSDRVADLEKILKEEDPGGEHYGELVKEYEEMKHLKETSNEMFISNNIVNLMIELEKVLNVPNYGNTLKETVSKIAVGLYR